MLTSKQVESAFNQWMDDFINDPESFQAIQDDAARHLEQRNGGAEPTYGQTCAAVLGKYLGVTFE